MELLPLPPYPLPSSRLVDPRRRHRDLLPFGGLGSSRRLSGSHSESYCARPLPRGPHVPVLFVRPDLVRRTPWPPTPTVPVLPSSRLTLSPVLGPLCHDTQFDSPTGRHLLPNTFCLPLYECRFFRSRAVGPLDPRVSDLGHVPSPDVPLTTLPLGSGGDGNGSPEVHLSSVVVLLPPRLDGTEGPRVKRIDGRHWTAETEGGPDSDGKLSPLPSFTPDATLGRRHFPVDPRHRPGSALGVRPGDRPRGTLPPDPSTPAIERGLRSAHHDK